MEDEETRSRRRIDLTKHAPQDLRDHMLGKRDLLAEEDAAARPERYDRILEVVDVLTTTLETATYLGLDDIDKAEAARMLASKYPFEA